MLETAPHAPTVEYTGSVGAMPKPAHDHPRPVIWQDVDTDVDGLVVRHYRYQVPRDTDDGRRIILGMAFTWQGALDGVADCIIGLAVRAGRSHCLRCGHPILGWHGQPPLSEPRLREAMAPIRWYHDHGAMKRIECPRAVGPDEARQPGRRYTLTA